jgi:TraY domain
MPRKAVEGAGKRVPLNMKTTEAIRARLEAAAAASGRSLTHEVEYRVERSFDHDEMVSSVMETIEENSQLKVQIMELKAELEKLKSAGPDASDLEAIVEKAVARALKQTQPVKNPKTPEPPRTLKEPGVYMFSLSNQRYNERLS